MSNNLKKEVMNQSTIKLSLVSKPEVRTPGLEPQNDQAEIQKIIVDCFDEEPQQLAMSGSGEVSRGYFFNIGDTPYIIRYATTQSGYLTDSIIGDLYITEGLVTPKTVNLGVMSGDRFFSITERCRGELLDDYDKNTQHVLLPYFLQSAHTQHTINVSRSRGYGPVDTEGNGIFPSWSDYISNEIERLTPVFESLYPGSNVMDNNANMSGYEPTNRSLIHGDYGFNNILATTDPPQITGTIDWSDARYGDFVFDIAYLSFWSTSLDYSKIMYEYYEKKGDLDLNDYNSRMHQYTVIIGLELYNHFRGTGDEDGAKYVKKKLDSYLKRQGLIK